MSSGYNDRLKPISYKGECGDKETEEPRSKWISKAKELAEWMKASKHTVVFTGAGISTSCGSQFCATPQLIRAACALRLCAHCVALRCVVVCSP